MLGIIAGLGYFLVAGILTGVYCLWSGWVLSVLWGWFAVPLFHLPHLSIKQSIGVSLLFTLLTHQYQGPTAKDKTEAEKYWGVVYPFVLGSLLLAIGWVVK